MKLGIDVLGNIVILKFDRDMKAKGKKRVALQFLKEHKSVRTVLEKAGGFSGRLRTQKSKWLAGEKTKEVLYKENGCVFRFNADTCYFSGRLASERLEISRKVKKDERVLVMFGGVAPFAIVIGKMSKAEKIVSVELSRECNKYAKMNVKRNKLQDRVQIVQGDVNRVLGSGKLVEKFDRIVMARPKLKDSFLDVAFSRVKKNGIIHYYGFSNPPTHPRSKDDKLSASELEFRDIKELKELITNEAKKARKKVRIQGIKKAGGGGIGPYRFRYRVDLKVL